MDFLESKAFKDWGKAREGEMKLQLAVINRLEAVMKAIGNLGEVLAHR